MSKEVYVFAPLSNVSFEGFEVPKMEAPIPGDPPNFKRGEGKSLGKGFELFEVSKEDASDYFSRLMRSISSKTFNSRMSDLGVFGESCFFIRKKYQLNARGMLEFYHDKIEPEFLCIRSASVLVKEGIFTSPFRLLSGVNGGDFGGGHTFFEAYQPSDKSPTFVFKERDLEKLKRYLNTDNLDLTFIRDATYFLEDSYFKQTPSFALLTCEIGLEFLFKKERPSRPMKRRIAYFIGPDCDLNELYKKRCDFVHEGETNHICYEDVKEIRKYLRLGIIYALKNGISSKEDFIERSSFLPITQFLQLIDG